MALSSNIKKFGLILAMSHLVGCNNSKTADGDAPPRSHYVYVLNNGDSSISQYTIDQSSGQLNPLCPPSTYQSPATPCAFALLPGQGHPLSITLDPSKIYAYVTTDAQLILTFNINQSTGQLTPTTRFLPISTGRNPIQMLFSPSGKYVYVLNNIDRNINIFSFNAANGQLLPISSSPFSIIHFYNPGTPYAILPTGSPNLPGAMTFEPSGNYLYVIDYNYGDIEILSVDTLMGTGHLLYSGTSAANSGTNASNSGCNYNNLTFDPTKLNLITAGTCNNIFSYNYISANGNLNPMTTQPSGPPQVFENALAFASLSAVVSSPVVPVGFIFDPSGQYAYVMTQNSGIAMLSYTSGTAGGTLSAQSGMFAVSNPPVPAGNLRNLANYSNNAAMVFDSTGNYLYAINTLNNKIIMFSFDPGSGNLIALYPQVVSTGGSPTAIIVN